MGSFDSSILAISATEYCIMAGRDLGDYQAVGVHGQSSNLSQPWLDISNSLPKGTEAFVNYRWHISDKPPTTPDGPPQSKLYYSGDALIPKAKLK
ncbi:MAG TPA: hypothetical protein VI933_04695 [archaeon]|nr:hypothetical protein [archaeon]